MQFLFIICSYNINDLPLLYDVSQGILFFSSWVVTVLIFVLQLISVGSNYNYGSEDQSEFLCVVSRDVSDSQEQGATGTEQSDKAKVTEKEDLY